MAHPNWQVQVSPVCSNCAITYANISQRNLQFLIMHLGPAVGRREDAFSRKLVSNPRYVKLNTDALLRMDPAETSKRYIRAIKRLKEILSSIPGFLESRRK